jgi:dipeptidase
MWVAIEFRDSKDVMHMEIWGLGMHIWIATGFRDSKYVMEMGI